MLYTPVNSQHQIFYINPFLRVLDFSLGILIFNLYVKMKKENFNIREDILEPLSILLLFSFFVLYPKVPEVFRFSIYYWLPMSFIILVFSFQKGKISKFLSHPLFVSLGEVSFGFYMIHQLVIRFSLQFFTFTNPLVFVLFTFGISLLLSYVSFNFYETPVSKYLKQRFIKVI